MDSTVSSSASLYNPKFRCFDPIYAFSATTNHKRSFVNLSPTSTPRARNCNGCMESSENSERKIVTGETGYVLEDVRHLADYIPDLPAYHNPLQENPSYSVVKLFFTRIVEEGHVVDVLDLARRFILNPMMYMYGL